MQQNTDEWLNFRKNKIGASDCPIIMGISPWKTPYQLWSEKIGITEPSVANQAMQRGTALEESARHKYIEMSGTNVFPQVVIHPTYPWMIASMDGRDISGEHAVEIKCPGKADHGSSQCGIIPIKYYPQLQHQLEVCGLEKMFYFSFDGVSGVILEIHRNDKYIEAMIKQEKEFFRCMQELESPVLTDRDYVQRNDNAWVNTAIEYKLTKLQLKELERKENELRERLAIMSGQKNSMGGGIKLQKIAKKGLIDYSKIEELRNIKLDVYRKPTSIYWKIMET